MFKQLFNEGYFKTHPSSSTNWVNMTKQLGQVAA